MHGHIHPWHIFNTHIHTIHNNNLREQWTMNDAATTEYMYSDGWIHAGQIYWNGDRMAARRPSNKTRDNFPMVFLWFLGERTATITTRRPPCYSHVSTRTLWYCYSSYRIARNRNPIQFGIDIDQVKVRFKWAKRRWRSGRSEYIFKFAVKEQRIVPGLNVVLCCIISLKYQK